MEDARLAAAREVLLDERPDLRAEVEAGRIVFRHGDSGSVHWHRVGAPVLN